MSEFSPAWLGLREDADAAARATALLDPLHRRLPAGPIAIHDLGCGTGAMGRWLAPRLPGPQHWVLHDRDPALLARAAAGLPRTVTAETRRTDLTTLTADTLAGAGLVTASALLDLCTREDVDRLAAACAGAGVPALLTLSVVGEVALTPADPLDPELTEAFNDHQRREARLGPDAAGATAEAFTRRGAAVWQEPSPWRLGPDRAALAAEWLRGWVAAACAQRPALAAPAAGYLRRRLAAAAAGELRVEVGHRDLLACPR